MEKNLKYIKKTTVFMLMLAFICIPLSNVKALYKDKSYYDKISWVYTYQATYTNSYNCLGWSTGSMTWEWPVIWGEAATVNQVTAYLKNKGYVQAQHPAVLTAATRILAYGPSANKITHFSKVLNKNVTAKWGSLERFSHGQNADPYYKDSPYGMARATYTK